MAPRKLLGGLVDFSMDDFVKAACDNVTFDGKPLPYSPEDYAELDEWGKAWHDWLDHGAKFPEHLLEEARRLKAKTVLDSQKAQA